MTRGRLDAVSSGSDPRELRRSGVAGTGLGEGMGPAGMPVFPWRGGAVTKLQELVAVIADYTIGSVIVFVYVATAQLRDERERGR